MFEFIEIMPHYIRTQLYLRSLGSSSPNAREASPKKSAGDIAPEPAMPADRIAAKLTMAEHEQAFPLPASIAKPEVRERL